MTTYWFILACAVSISLSGDVFRFCEICMTEKGPGKGELFWVTKTPTTDRNACYAAGSRHIAGTCFLIITVSYACKRKPVQDITVNSASNTTIYTSCTLVSNLCATKDCTNLLNSINLWKLCLLIAGLTSV